MRTILIMVLGAAVTAVAADGRVINFRGEASGGYPDACPPTTFSTTRMVASCTMDGEDE